MQHFNGLAIQQLETEVCQNKCSVSACYIYRKNERRIKNKIKH